RSSSSSCTARTPPGNAAARASRKRTRPRTWPLVTWSPAPVTSSRLLTCACRRGCSPRGGLTMAADTLTVTDNRTGQKYEIPIENGAVRAMDFQKIREKPDTPGLLVYDPAFGNTASCKSRITYIDGDAGVLLYRGYPIEQLAERSTFLETAYLLLKG